MANAAVVEAIEAAFESQFPAVVLVKNNTQGRPSAPPFVMIQYPLSIAEQITFGAPGSNTFREEGGIRFVLHVKYKDQDARIEGLELAEEIAAAFRGKRISGVRTMAPSSPVEDDNNEDGRFYVLSFTLPYEFDTFG